MGLRRKAYQSERLENIEEIRQEILSMHLSRLIVFSDFIDRYLHLKLKEYRYWLKVNAILFLITRGGKLTTGQLAKLMIRSRNSITKLVDSLKEEGLVRRSYTDKDRRLVFIEVTSKGLEYTISNLKKLGPAEEEIKKCLEDDELQTLVNLSRKLRLKLIEQITGMKS